MAIEALRTAWVNTPAVVALVPATRIQVLRRTQNIGTPGIALQRVSSVPFNHLRGTGDLDANLVQADFYGEDYTALRAIADACRAAGDAAGFLLTSEIDGYNPETDPELYRITQTWSVFT